MGAAAAAAQLDLTVGLAGAPGARTVCGAAPVSRRLPGAPGNTALPPGRAGGGAARGHLRPWRAGIARARRGGRGRAELHVVPL